jgi:hypothetical protein
LTTTRKTTPRVLSTTVETFEKYIRVVDAVADHLSATDLTLFRGQGKQGNLLPGIARIDPSKDTSVSETEVLEQLRLLGASFHELSQQTDLDLLVVAQHFGLKTRLLDWSSNALAALWFACSSSGGGDCYVYALDADKLRNKNVYSTSPFETDKTYVFQPRLNNARIVAQHGWFTLHRYSKTSKRFVALDRNPSIRNQLTEIVIPADAKEPMLKALDRFGVNGRSLYPDLQGLSSYLNWKHKLYS